MEKNYEIEVKNGLYIGDLCYALADEVYYGVWGKSEYKDDAFVDPKTGLMFAMVSTKYGDGSYKDSVSKFYYPVDAGIIGICDLKLATELGQYRDCPGRLLSDIKGLVVINYKDGKITIYQKVVNKQTNKIEKYYLAKIDTNC